jgi:glutathione S-transferase
MQLELFEIVNAEGVSFSPFVWRARCALLLKGLHWDPVFLGFTDPRDGFDTFPALRHDGEVVCGSWDIAEYLGERFVDRPRLFGDEQGHSLARFVTAWVDNQVMPVVFRGMVADICASARPGDREYFRAQKELSLGDTLENTQLRQRAKPTRLKGLLEPARRLFKEQDYFGVGSPLYPDFALFGVFKWARISSGYPLLEEGDPVADWLARMDAWLDRQETLLALRYS